MTKFGPRFLFRAAWALMLLLLGGVVGSQFFGRPGYHKQGSLVWIDGRSYVDATRTLQALEDKVRAELIALLAQRRGEESGRSPSRTARRRHGRRAGSGRRAAETGRWAEVGSGRSVRAVLLDDGTPVYLNRNTSVTYECRGELRLNCGEIYVERRFSRRDAANAADKRTSAE